MAPRIEWRTTASGEILLVVDNCSRVTAALRAEQALLSKFLRVAGNFDEWVGTEDLDNVEPESWGDLVLSRADTGEVLEIDPELFWDRIQRLFRVHGADYDNDVWMTDERPTTESEDTHA
jgi:hypothetical protein